ncbi:MAG: tungstate transporter permease, partial [Chloroflexi bacterium]
LSGETRVLTTAAVLEVNRGNFGTALALGLILLMLVVLVSAALTTAQARVRR